MGGAGKTTLIEALTHDEDIRHLFPDGILQASLGRIPDLLPILDKWIQQLGDFSSKLTSEEAASNHLTTLLSDKRVLLVLDDIWEPEHAWPFQLNGIGCCLLLTTRREFVADKLQAEKHLLNEMTEEEALELLAKRSGITFSVLEEEQARKLVKALGYLPKALELAAVRLNKGVPCEQLWAAFSQEFSQLEVLESARDRLKREDLTIEALFNISLEFYRKTSPVFGSVLLG